MSKFVLTVAAAALSLAATFAHANRDDAEALHKAALAEARAKGVEGAGKEFSNGGPWIKGSTYVFIADFKATVLAHSANPKIIGKNLWDVKDADGKLFVQDQVRIAQTVGTGTVQMRWMNPATKQIGDAEVLLARIPGAEAYLGTVYFK